LGNRAAAPAFGSVMAEEFLGGLVLPYHIVLLRLVGAALLCGLIGFEREATEHSAGLRTHMLVGLGAASFALLTVHVVEMFADRSDAVRLDPVRLIEAATSGVAFLAAGMIVLSRGRVRNLTTGAGLWLAAAIGLACGLGLWPIAATGAVLGLFIVGVLRVASKGDEEDGPI
jgi:putative Mg2+ transporter-C (MgtC) family protein